MEARTGDELLRVEKLGRAGEFEDISFALRRGEILGIYGLVGAGRTELAQVLFGVAARRSRHASRGAADIALVPEDRQTQGSILPFLDRREYRAAESRDAGAARLVHGAARSAARASVDRRARHQGAGPGAARAATSRAATSRKW